MDHLLGLFDAVVDVGWIFLWLTLAVALGFLIVDRRSRPPRVPWL